MVWAWQALAKAKPPAPARAWLDSRFLWAAFALVALLLVGALVLAIINRWLKRSNPETMDVGDELAQFQELYEEGQLSQAEFDRIRTKLTGKLFKQKDVPGSTTQQTPPQPQAPEKPESEPNNP